MPFRNPDQPQMPNPFKGSNSYETGLESLRQVLSMRNQEQQLAEQQQMLNQMRLAMMNPQDLGVPEEGEDLSDFEPDPDTMPWTAEAQERMQRTYRGETDADIQQRAVLAQNQQRVQENVLTAEEQEGIDFLDRLAAAEKSNGYNIKSKSGTMTGRYQFDWSQWGDDIMRETGVKNQEEFLRSAEAQDRFANGWYRKNVLETESKPLYEGFKKFYPDASEEDLMVAMHLAGGPNIRKGIRDGNLTNWRDGNGISIREYLNRSQSAHSRNVIPNEGVDFDVDEDLKSRLDKLQKRLGIELYIESGHRNEERNRRANGAKNSAHKRKRAVDLDLTKIGKDKDYEFKRRLIKEASDLGFLGIGVYNNNIHLDNDPELGRRYWGPDYTHKSAPSWAQDLLVQHKNRK